MQVSKTEVARYVTEMQNGDGQAFAKLYNATNQSGYFTALKILKDEEEAQDVLQDSYITVLEKINEIRDPESFVSWFHQIVANKAKNYLAKKKPSLFASDDEEQEVTEFLPDEDEVWQPEKNVDEDDVRRQVMQIIEGLTDEKRTCVLLYYYNELSVADIAKAVGASENTVKARLFQARKDIRKEVEKLGAKNISLRGVAPIPLVIWALRIASKADGAKFAAGPAAATIMESAAAAASSGAAASGAAAGAAAAGAANTAAAGGGLVAKIAAMTVSQKVIAGVVAAGIAAGAGTAAGRAIVHKNDDEVTETTVAVEAFAESLTVEQLEEEITFSDTWETETQAEETQTEPPTEPTATTAAAAEDAAVSTAATVIRAEASSGAARTERTYGFTSPGSVSTKKPEPMTRESTSEESATIGQEETTQMTTGATKSSGGGTLAPTSEMTRPKPTQTITETEAPKPKGKATVVVHYSVANYADSDTITLTVDEGEAVTKAMVLDALREHLQGTYGENLKFISPTINVPSAEADQTYEYTVNVLVM